MTRPGPTREIRLEATGLYDVRSGQRLEVPAVSSQLSAVSCHQSSVKCPLSDGTWQLSNVGLGGEQLKVSVGQIESIKETSQTLSSPVKCLPGVFESSLASR